MKTLGVITARKGSRGIVGKNMAMLCGKPLLHHTLIAAVNSRLSRVIISTDCPEMAAFAKRYAVDAPFMRPAELATDTASSIDVLRHAAEQCPGWDAIFCLQPTNPLRTVEDINGAIDLMESTICDSVISFVDVGERHPARMRAIDSNGRVSTPVFAEADNRPRQQLPPYYLRDGSIYLTRLDVLQSGRLQGDDCRAWIMPRERSVNIDEPMDLVLAEAMMEYNASRD
jgi:CMP-N,N'-diacetyllegionaminic acid synthase